MYLAVTEVKPTHEFTLLLTFANGEKRKFDMRPILDTGIFTQLKDSLVFNTAHISFDTVEWDNEADLDPEYLYKNSVPITN